MDKKTAEELINAAEGKYKWREILVAKGFLEGSAQLDEAVELLKDLWEGNTKLFDGRVGDLLKKHGRLPE